MGVLRSEVDYRGIEVNGVALGEPAYQQDEQGVRVGSFRWDHFRLPNGVIDAEGLIVPDDEGLAY